MAVHPVAYAAAFRILVQEFISDYINPLDPQPPVIKLVTADCTRGPETDDMYSVVFTVPDAHINHIFASYHVTVDLAYKWTKTPPIGGLPGFFKVSPNVQFVKLTKERQSSTVSAW